VGRTACFLRALQIESETFEPAPGAPPGAHSERLAAASALLDRWLAAAGAEPSPALVVGLDRLAALDLRLGHREAARGRLERLARLDRAAVRQGDSRLAFLLDYPASLVEAILEEAPYRLADLAAAGGDPRPALAAYEAALARSPRSLLAPWARLRRAELHAATGQVDLAAGERRRGLAALEAATAPGVPASIPAALVDEWRRALRGKLEGP
jgi:hypothetical protein